MGNIGSIIDLHKRVNISCCLRDQSYLLYLHTLIVDQTGGAFDLHQHLDLVPPIPTPCTGFYPAR